MKRQLVIYTYYSFCSVYVFFATTDLVYNRCIRCILSHQIMRQAYILHLMLTLSCKLTNGLCNLHTVIFRQVHLSVCGRHTPDVGAHVAHVLHGLLRVPPCHHPGILSPRQCVSHTCVSVRTQDVRGTVCQRGEHHLWHLR